MAAKAFEMKVLIGTCLLVDQMYNLLKENFAILHLSQQGSLPSLSLNLDVLPCPASSQYFTGRKGDLQKLSRMLAAPVVTLSGMNSDALLAFVHRFEHLARFTTIFLDASSVEALNMGLKAMVHNIKADDNTQKLHFLVLENADPSLELNKCLPLSLHTPILIASTNEAVSHFASAQAYKFKLLDSADQFSADNLYESIGRAFDSLQHVVTIVAKGGTGKTQLVYRFVSENPSRFTHVWFLDATSNATLTADFEKLGKAACVGESVEEVRDFLRRMHEDWLVVFDNADDPNVDLSNYIPECNHGSVIITSRLTEVNQMASPDFHIDFGDLEQSDAVDLLLKHAHVEFNNNNQQLASVIVNTLGCQALAVATAGAYIASTATCTLSEYLPLFEQKCKHLLKYKMKALDSYQKTVFSAFELSFEKLSPSAKMFIQICAFFHHTAIPVELFHRASAFTGDDLWPEEKKKAPAVEDLKQFLSYFPCNASWNEVIDELNSLSLIIYDTSAKTLSFHSVLQMCIQETIDDKEKICYTTGMLLARATSYSIKGADYEFQRMLITHVESIYKNNCFTFLIYKSLVRIGDNAGVLIATEGIAEEALEYCEHSFGKHHHNTLIAMANLAATYWQQGQLQKAEALDEEILKLRKKVFGELHPDTLEAMGNLAATYRQQGQLQKAEALEEETLKLRKKVLGELHPDTLSAMGNLAATYKQQGQLQKAEALAEETLKLQKKVLGELHPDTL
ncbi:P-loop containing nucleoside triphosphate hydrolase protein, partial [Armillaria novae-zelandiae]